MSDVAMGRGGWAAARYPTTDDIWEATGRHALDEDAGLTPIFHALTRSGWRDRQHEPTRGQRAADPVDAFRRDPLTAPIPVQAVGPAPARPGRPAVRARAMSGAMSSAGAGAHGNERHSGRIGSDERAVRSRY